MGADIFARGLVIFGFFIVLIGAIIWLVGKTGMPIGQLPGDISVSKEKFSFYFPLVSSIVISIILTIVLNLILWIMRK